MAPVKSLLHRLFRSIGYDIMKKSTLDHVPFGRDPYKDMGGFLEKIDEPMIFDIGGNKGQSVEKFKNAFPNATVNSFEPSPVTFQLLDEVCNRFQKTQAWNFGVGSSSGILPFLENSYSDMSSFLEPDERCWGKIDNVTDVEVLTLDDFTIQHDISFINILKCDTQGFDLEVFKGAKRLMSENRIGLIYFEVIFSKMYQQSPGLCEIVNYLLENGFLIVGFYDQHYQQNLLSWTDLMLINANYKKELGK